MTEKGTDDEFKTFGNTLDIEETPEYDEKEPDLEEDPLYIEWRKSLSPICLYLMLWNLLLIGSFWLCL